MGSHEGTQQAPEQLPVVLQVLLSQQHRLRALELLERFLELGPWAVREALSVGIFPYVFKLLGSPAQELKPVLISLWTKILAVDPECKLDLTKSPATPARKAPSAPINTKAFMYFVLTLGDERYDPDLRTMAAFVIAVRIAKSEGVAWPIAHALSLSVPVPAQIHEAAGNALTPCLPILAWRQVAQRTYLF